MNMENRWNALKNIDDSLWIENIPSIDNQKKYLNNKGGSDQSENLFNLNTKNNKRNMTNIQKSKIEINKEIKNHIRFLLRLYFHYERINYKINEYFYNNINSEKFYLVNNQIIEKYKKFYKYNDLVNILNEKGIELLINQYKKFDSYINGNKMNELIDRIMEHMLFLSYFNSLKDYNFNILNKNNDLFDIKPNEYKKNIIYYNNFEFIDEETIRLIDINNEENEDNLSKNKLDFILGEKRIILVISSNLINIGYLHNNIFNIEMIIKIKEQGNINIIIDKIKNLNFNGFKNILLFNQDNISDLIDLNCVIYNLSEEKNDCLLMIKRSLNKLDNLKKDYSNSSKLDDNKEIKELIINSNCQQIEGSKMIILNNQNKGNHNINEENQTFEINVSINLEAIEEKNVLGRTINDELKDLILLYIDYNDLKKKMKNSLISNENNINNYYYLINYDWLKTFINLNNMDNIFDFLLNNHKLENICNNDYLTIDEKISKIIYMINSNEINNNHKNDKYKNILQNYNLFYAKYKLIQENSKKSFYYFYDFLILKEERFYSLTKNLNFFNNNKFYCMFGDGKIFIFPNYGNSFIIEIGTFNKNWQFIIEFIFDYNSKEIYQKNLGSLINNGFKDYIDCKLLFCFQNDYVSPIFDENYKIVGNAIKYNEKITDYKNYFINKYLKTLVKFYFHNVQLRLLIGSKIFEFKKYYLISEDWLNRYKNYFIYDNIAQQLQNNQIVKNLKPDDKDLFNEKKLVLLIKSLPIDINIELNKKEKLKEYVNNIQVEPNIDAYTYDYNKYLMYYNKFQIISLEMYDLIFDDVRHSRLNQLKNNFVNCIFYENIIIIELSKYINENDKYILEVGYIDFNTYKFFPLYILIYKDIKDFLNHMSYIKNNIGINKFFNSFNFNETNNLPIYDWQNKQIGKIYNLKIKFKI